MLFQVICYILATTALIKGLTGLFAHETLYGWAEKHYSETKKSATVQVMVAYAFIILILTWYATLFDYVKYGWIITVFISLMSIKTLTLIFKWEEASKKFVKLIKSGGATLWTLDIIVIVLSIIFYSLGYFLY
jgi:hypothetical protein